MKRKKVITMPKDYILKNEITSPGKIQRLLKTIDTNAKKDREEAQDLLRTVREALSNLDNPIEHNNQTGSTTVDSFTKLINTAILALNQAGIANERLLKLANLLQKYQADTKKTGSNVNLTGSLFKTIEDLANKGPSDD